jgi:hypothetical protein
MVVRSMKPALFRTRLACLALLALGAVGTLAPVHAQGAEQVPGVPAADERHPLRGLTPQQRREFWQQMTPEQRDRLWQQLTPEQRQGVWRSLSPAQREAIRQFGTEQREPRNRPPAAPGAPPAPQAGDGRAGPGRLTPEERRELREQIREAHGEFRAGRPGHHRN